VRSKEGRFLDEENFMLKTKRECEREEEEGDPRRGIGQCVQRIHSQHEFYGRAYDFGY
jgi:hypothetical protein